MDAEYKALMAMLTESRKDFGRSRLMMGAALCALHDSEQWDGRAHGGFNAFLRENGIEPNSANQFMRVSRRFILDLTLEPEQMDQLFLCPIGVLVAAAPVVNMQNLGEALAIATSLSRDDAIETFKSWPFVPLGAAKSLPMDTHFAEATESVEAESEADGGQGQGGNTDIDAAEVIRPRARSPMPQRRRVQPSRALQ